MWGAAEVCVVGDVDLDELAASGPPELLLWVRFEGAPLDDGLNRGLLAYASEPYFFGAALRPTRGPESGVGRHTPPFPAVITHSVTFHGPVSAADWLLLDIASPHLGRGRIYGKASVFSEAGEFCWHRCPRRTSFVRSNRPEAPNSRVEGAQPRRRALNLT